MTSLEGSQYSQRKKCTIGLEWMRFNFFMYFFNFDTLSVGFENGFENGEGCEWKDEGDD